MISLEPVLESLARDGFVTVDSFFSDSLVTQLFDKAKASYQDGDFHPARVGQGPQKKRRQAVRGDQIRWIGDWSKPPLQDVGSVLGNIQDHLRSFLYLPIKRFESHFAFYPIGAHYLKHRDRHRLNPSRLISCVIYLSPFSSYNGGELVLYIDSKPILIEPQAGRMVLFLSELEHEVRPTKAERWSLTTWFRDDLVAEIHLS